MCRDTDVLEKREMFVASELTMVCAVVSFRDATIQVRVWDIRKQRCCYTLPAHSALVADVR